MCDTIRRLHADGCWVEVVTLLVPGFNDDPGELAELTGFLAGVSADLPWHVTAFHADYRMRDHDDTQAQALETAAAIGRASGLRFVYAGNRPGQVGALENTRCPSCDTTLVERRGHRVTASRLSGDGRCPSCDLVVPGRWASAPDRSAPATRASC